MSMSNPKGIHNLSDKFLSSLIKTKPVTPKAPKVVAQGMKVNSLSELKSKGFTGMGTGIYRDAQHHLWTIEKSADGYSLLRNAEEDESSEDSEDHSVTAGKTADKDWLEKLAPKEKSICECGHDRPEHRGLASCFRCGCQEFKKKKTSSKTDESNPVVSAIARRIMNQHVDLLRNHGPEKVMEAIEDVAYGVGKIEEIGSSDVSIWVESVE